MLYLEPKQKNRSALLMLLILMTTVTLPDRSLLADSPSGFSEHQQLTKQTLELHIRPLHADFAASTMQQKALWDTFCSTPKSDLSTLQQAYKRTLVARARIEPITFGPVQLDNRADRLIFWPDRKQLAKRQVINAIRHQDPLVVDDITLPQQSVALQGFTALEQILYAPDIDSVGIPSPIGRFRCRFGQSVAANIASIASQLEQAWQAPEGYSQWLLNPGPANPVYLSDDETTREISLALTKGLEQLLSRKMLRPLGLIDPRLKPTPAPFSDSKMTAAYIGGIADGLQHLYSNSGLLEIIRIRERQRSVSISSTVESTLQWMKAHAARLQAHNDGSLSNPQARNDLLIYGNALEQLMIKTDAVFTDVLGLSLGFNANDGD